jgi:hypothetical protein
VNLKKGDLHRSFEWGETSNALTYATTPPWEEPKTAKKGGLLGKLGKSSSSATENKPQPSVPLVSGKTETAMAAALQAAEHNKKTLQGAVQTNTAEDDRPYILPPGRRCKSTKDLNGFYMWASGYLPEGWEEGVNRPEKAKPARIKKEFKNFDEAVAKGSLILAKGGKAPATIINAPEAGTAIKTDVLTANQRKSMIDVVKPKLVTNIDDKNAFVSDPAKIAEEMKDRELLSQALPGFFIEGLATVFRWKKDAFTLLRKHDPEVADLLFEEMRLRLWQQDLMLKSLRKEEKEKKSAVM